MIDIEKSLQDQKKHIKGVKPKPCVLLDLDGSISNDYKRFDRLRKKEISWKEYFFLSFKDKPIEKTYKLIKEIQKKYPDVEIIVSTGRPVYIYKQTKKWVHDLGIMAKKFLMRPAYNFEKNHILKEKNLKKVWSQGYFVVLAVEDNIEAIYMYKKHKVAVFEVKRKMG